MKRKVIIFDMDGVLFDSVKIVGDFLLSQYPTMTIEIMDEILTGNFHIELEKFKSTNKRIEETPEENKARSEKYSQDKSQAPLFKGIKELLKELHKNGYILTVNTSALAINCVPLLKSVDIDNLFDFVATSEISKSKIEKFKIIEEKYSTSKDEMLFITDTLGDVKEADVAGVPTIAVTWGAHNRSYLNREIHNNLIAICDSVEELEKLIRGV